jgi:hypothetical protein
VRRRGETLIEREDVDAILGALLDIRSELAAIRRMTRRPAKDRFPVVVVPGQ